MQPARRRPLRGNALQDCVILTLACGKYRFNKLDFGEIAGLPRLMDVGQCNDVYSAVRIATALADAFNTDVNGLPLSMIVSWYEQKAVADLLALLSLGVRNIYLGPTLPAFLSPNVLQYLVDTFHIRAISIPTTRSSTPASSRVPASRRRLTQMVGSQPGVGLCGAMLYYPDEARRQRAAAAGICSGWPRCRISPP